ncbi:disulfide bond formation protein B [Patescibacteria group bacterium AH-259-L07]|nr:disulfide bond formation protein B [Patescibacteria group bacterium AH-259-L07]
MDPFISIYAKILAFLTIIAGASIIFIILCFFAPLFKKRFLPFIKKYAIELACIVSLGAVIGSLLYSELIGFIPCKLCWFQRVFMYPLALILAIAVIKKDKRVTDYVLSLSLGGAIIAILHYYIQMSGSPNFLCPGTDPSLSCVQRLIFEFNFITIPLMSFMVFTLVALLMISRKLKTK